MSYIILRNLRKFLANNLSELTYNDNRTFQKLDTTIRLFNRSDYYTVHGSDALFAAQEIFKTTSVCKMIGAGKCLFRLK